MTVRRRKKVGFFRHHSLSIVTAGVLTLWIVLYRASNEHTHVGSFFGNAIADWTGLLVTILATKFLYEKGSKESRKPPHPLVRPVWGFLQAHSLTIFLVLTGIGWTFLFRSMDSESKWGEVVGNLVSEWTQTLGLVLMTKKLVETRSKE
jgi:hypothetical protein